MNSRTFSPNTEDVEKTIHEAPIVHVDDYELKMWEEPPKVEKKPIRDALPVSKGNKQGKYTYTVFSDNTAEVTRYSGKSRTVTIPGQIDGKTVTSIGAGAFYYRNWIKKVTIPDSVFYLGDRVFARCSQLTDIEIPKSVRIVGDYAFANTPWLKAQKEDFVLVGDAVLIAYNGKSGDVRIPDGVKSISSAFYRTGRMTSLVIPSNVKYMADYAFMFCRNMKTLVIEDGVEAISDCAFAGCTGLKDVFVGKNVKEFGDYAFWKCNHLESIVFQTGVERLGIGVFWICIRLKSVRLPDTVTSIGRWAFYHCRDLESVTIPPASRPSDLISFRHATS